MPLSQEEIDSLLRLIGHTEDAEINCEQCLALVAEFAEQQLRGRSVHEGLKAVEQHLSVCTECRDEYEALRRTLDNAGDSHE